MQWRRENAGGVIAYRDLGKKVTHCKAVGCNAAQYSTCIVGICCSVLHSVDCAGAMANLESSIQLLKAPWAASSDVLLSSLLERPCGHSLGHGLGHGYDHCHGTGQGMFMAMPVVVAMAMHQAVPYQINVARRQNGLPLTNAVWIPHHQSTGIALDSSEFGR